MNSHNGLLKIEQQKLGGGRLMIGLDGELSIYSVNKIYKILKNAFNSYTEIIMDLSKVSWFDTATIQMFLIAKKDSEKKNIKFQLLKPANEIKQMLEITGVKYILEKS